MISITIISRYLPRESRFSPAYSSMYWFAPLVLALRCSHWSQSWRPLLPEVMRTPGKPWRAGQPDRARQTRKLAGFYRDERGHKLRRTKRGRTEERPRRGGWGRDKESRLKKTWVCRRTVGSVTPWSGVSLWGVGTYGDRRALSTDLLTSYRNAGGN